MRTTFAEMISSVAKKVSAVEEIISANAEIYFQR